MSTPGPRSGKVPGRKWVQGSWVGVSGLPLLRGVIPQEVRPPTPRFGRLNSRAFLRKCLSWQQLQPSRAGLAHQLPRSRAGGEGGGARAGTEAGLGERPGQFSAVKVARLRAAAASWFALRRNGEILSALGFLPALTLDG